MNDPLALAQIIRAETALIAARQSMGGEDTRGRAKGFIEVAKTIFGAKTANEAVGFMQNSRSEIVAKAASAHLTLDDYWRGPDAQAMAAAFIGSVDEPDLLTAIGRYAGVIPGLAQRVLVASGAVGDVVAEGFPKVVKRLDLSLGADLEYTKSAAAVVVSRELLSAVGEAGRRLFESELTKAVIRTANATAVAALIDSNTTSIAAGADPLASLRAGLMAAGTSLGFVVTAPAGWVAWLSTHEANRSGMSVRGGEFVPGVEIIALDDATSMTVIPAERLAMINGGIQLRPSGHATVDMSDTPSSPSQQVSLWQTNCVGLLVERWWRIEGDTTGIVRVGA